MTERPHLRKWWFARDAAVKFIYKGENRMVKVIEDGTKKTYYTECVKCGSSMTYEYTDVNVDEEKIDFLNQYLVLASKSVQCPVCGFNNYVVMQTEEEYKEAKSRFPSSPTFNSRITEDENQCCCCK